MGRAYDAMRVVTIVAFLVGIAFFFGPTNTDIAPLALPELSVVTETPPDARAYADSLSEDIILHNLFSSSRTAPSGRYRGPGLATQDADAIGAGGEAMGATGFAPSLVGTAVSERPGATRALLVLDPADLTPRLYAVGEGAGGYRVVSIEARSVELAGPRGRVVLRLPQDLEDNS
jgi:hypothetical protein